MFILASQSPRRRQLLAGAGLSFAILPVEVDESPQAGEAPPHFVERLAREKAQAARRRPEIPPGQTVLGADTIVVLDGELIGKPSGRPDAEAMLRRLSGRTHVVYTGVCVLDSGDFERKIVVGTEVLFRRLTDRELDLYLSTEEPYDKAGAYAIQGAGAGLVERISGSYTNVIGLPLAETLTLLAGAGVTT